MTEMNGHEKKWLPKGWEWIELGKLCEKILKVRVREQHEEKEFLYLDIGSIDNTNNKIISHKTYLWKDAPSRAQQIVQKDDVLFSTVRTYMKNIALIGSPLYDNQIASSGFTVLRSKKNVLHPKFLFYRTISNVFLEPLNKLQTGSSYPAVRDKDVLSQKIPVPTYDEQEQVVSKIEELFSELAKSIEQLKTTQQQLKVYRQSVLKSAFEGKLTNENVKEGELPNGWITEVLGNISEMCLGKMLDKQKNKGSLRPYLRNISVRWGSFDLNDLEQMKFEENELERYSLKKGDLVVCEGGEPGRCAIWSLNNESMMIQKALHRVRVNDRTDVKYVYYFIFFSSLTGALERYFTGTTIKHLTGKELRRLALPLPSFDEQKQISQEIENRLSIADKLEETITNSLQQAEALRQSILKKAFDGSLLSDL